MQQLNEIKQTLDKLQLISSVGAVASVANLGLCAVGFTVVYKKLNRIDDKLDTTLLQLASVKQRLEEMHCKWEALTLAKLKTAADHLDIAQQATSSISRSDHARIAREYFSEHRNYFLELLKRTSAWLDGSIPMPSSTELYSRYIFCCLGHLHAEFMMNDLETYDNTLNLVKNDLRSISSFEKKDAFRSRHDTLVATQGFVPEQDRLLLIKQVQQGFEICKETFERIDSMSVESKHLLKSGMRPTEYLTEIRKLKPDVICIPASF